MKFPVNTPGGGAAPVDWQALKQEILGKLDVRAEYEALGVRFTHQAPNAKGILECHAVGREDERPSAMVNVRTGVYHDSGSGESLNLWDFALRYGQGLGRHIDAIRHYGAKAGIDVPTPRYLSGGRIREATYIYRDERGKPLFAVFRSRLPTGKKSFSQHPPDGSGGWKFGSGCMDGVRLVPYRLPELVEADPAETIWVVEGERDADRLAAEGLTPTCNPMGAGKWRDEFAPYFANRNVVVIPDNDPAGLKHGITVCASLKPGVASLKLLELPDLPPKGDVSDWLDAGNTIDELGRLAHACPEWDPAAEGLVEEKPEPRRRPAHLGDLRQNLSDARWIWPMWLPTSRIAGLAAGEGIGKTRLILDLARRIWHGLPWPDGQAPTFPPHTPTLWLCADGNQDDLAEAVGMMGLPDEAIFLNTAPEDPYGGTDIDSEDVLSDLDEYIPLIRPALIVIDSLTFATRRDLCRQNEVKVLMSPLQAIAQNHRVTIVPLLHLSRDGQALGRRIRGITRTVIQLECPDPDRQPDRRRLWVEKSIDKKPPALGVTMGATGNEYDASPPTGTRAGAPPTERDRARQFLMAALTLRNDRRLVEIKNEFLGQGGSEGTFWRARDEMVAAGELVCEGTPKILHLTNGVPVNGEPF
jgi:hypothetical protein